MKKVAFVVAAVSLFAFVPIEARLGPVPSSLALVWLTVLAAMLASGSVHSLAIASGAAGAFAGGVLAPVSPSAAGAVLVAAVFAERTMRVRSPGARAVHVLLAAVGGALAGALGSAFTSASLSVFVVAAVVAGVLASLPLLVEADDPVAHSLALTARLVTGPARRSLDEAAELRRSTGDIPLDRATSAKVKGTWASLLRLAEARTRLGRARPAVRVARAPEPAQAGRDAASPSEAAASAADAVLAMVDQRIEEHVRVLERAYTAVDTVTAARVGIDDSALKNVETIGESLDEVSRALVEVRGDDRLEVR